MLFAPPGDERERKERGPSSSTGDGPGHSATTAWVEVPFEVPPDRAGWRLDSFLAARLRTYSRARVVKLITEGRISRPAPRPVKPAGRVAGGERIVVRYPRRPEEPARYDRLPVVYEDGRLLAVAKPGDLLTHPTDRVVENTVTGVLGRQFPGLRLRPAHRLDRETSGLLLLAKDAEAARTLQTAFAAGRVRKEYLALVAGRARFGERLVALPIGREGGDIKVRQAALASGRAASTCVEVLAAAAEASLVRARPRSGRLHQIRVHLAALGHPVLGDKLYRGSGEAYLKAVRRELTPEDLAELGAPRQMLHAAAVELAHPDDGRRLRIECPAPADFAACAAARRLALSAAEGGARG